MKNKIKKILFVLFLMFAFSLNVNAETKIKEDVSEYTGDVYIIGSSKFDSNTIVTGTMASKAGAREAYVQYFINGNLSFNADNIRIYYYSSLDETWSLLPATKNDTIRDLTNAEISELTSNLMTYYVNDEEKILEIPYDIQLRQGTELAFVVDNMSKLDQVRYENGKLFVPATITVLNTYAKNELDEYALLDTFNQVDTVFESASNVVTTLLELKEAIDDEASEIRLGNDITGINEIITIPYTVELRGAGYKLSFENITKNASNVASALVILGDGSNITDLTVEMDNRSGWQGNYALQVYNAKGVTITNYKGTKADAALLVNASEVTLHGNIDVSGNEFGGIEVSKGAAAGLSNSTLVVNGNVTMSNEEITRPVIWLEKDQGSITLSDNDMFVINDSVPTDMGKDQTYYYSDESVYKSINVGSIEQLTLANTIDDVEEITLVDDIDLPTAVQITKKLTLNLNNHRLSVEEDTAGDGVFFVRDNGDLTINGDGIIDGVGNNDWNMAIYAKNGKVTINGGTFTNTSTTGTDDHYDLIYASGTAQIEINGGRFEGKTPAWLLNIQDSNRATASIFVKGGTFVGFDPSDCKTEGEGTNFVASGYEVVEVNGEYTVNLES